MKLHLKADNALRRSKWALDVVVEIAVRDLALQDHVLDRGGGDPRAKSEREKRDERYEPANHRRSCRTCVTKIWAGACGDAGPLDQNL